jgi:3-oxoacyl-(acyl-carrier-protein) synthase
MTVNGFNALELLSAARCNPFSANRNGITIGEGAAAFLVSREAGPIKLLGIGETSDAYHLTAPDPTGSGAKTAMEQALVEARLGSNDITISTCTERPPHLTMLWKLALLPTFLARLCHAARQKA